MNKLTIFERVERDVTFLDLNGDVIFGDGNLLLRDAIREVLGKGRNKIHLNFEAVCYVDSSGIGELVSGYTAINRAGGELKLMNLSTRVKELLIICKLLPIFDIYEESNFVASQQ